jgi:serine/threonine protein kinase
MSTYTSEPGTRLAGRYRLVDQAGAGAGWTSWKAVDEPLARSVTVLTFAPDFPRITEALTAARAASRLGDPRFSQVFDVEDADELAYVVMEWVTGNSLLDMLADGPLDASRAVTLAYEAAQALTAAHAAGLAHLRLSPDCVHWTRGSGVKITGLGIDAVLSGPAAAGTATAGMATAALEVADPETGGLETTDPETADLEVADLEVADLEMADLEMETASSETAGFDPQDGEDTEPAGDSPDLTDTRDLARLLYAALTGYWPGPRPAELFTAGDLPADDDPEPAQPGRLPPAPEADGIPRTPRQVSAAVPADIDAVTCRAMFQRPDHHGPALTTPAMLAEALADVAPPALLPGPAAPTTSIRVPATSTDGFRPGGPASTTPRAAVPYQRSGERRSPMTIIVGVVVVLVLAAGGIAGWAFSHRGSSGTAVPPASGPASSSAPAAAASVVLTPVSANSFDALGHDGGNEDGGQAMNAIDNDPGTFWHTDYYLGYPALGNLKEGTGLILDMGKQVRLSQVVVQFGTSCCTDVQVEIGNNSHPVPSALSSFTSVASSSSAHGVTTFNVSSATSGRYVLIWLTRLPPLAGAANEYQAQIYNVVVHGSAVSQSG